MSAATQDHRRRMPTERKSMTHRAVVGGFRFYITSGTYEDGSLGEVFIKNAGREGSTVQGLLDGFATSISINLQYGAPFESLARKFAFMNFEPRGQTDNPDLSYAFSVIDYSVRWLARHHGDEDLNKELDQIAAEMLDATKRRLPVVQKPVVEVVCRSCSALMARVNGHYQCSCGKIEDLSSADS